MVTKTELKELISGDITATDLKKISAVILKFNKYPKLTKNLIKVLAKVWSEGKEEDRVLAFLNLVKILKTDEHFDSTVKVLYAAYVRNCKFMNASSASAVAFMQRSLSEILSIFLHLSYQHAFVYIRQMAINLRKAMAVPKKENTQAVYCWQFVNCLTLWARFLRQGSPSSEMVTSLIHPLTQVIVGTINLSPGAKWLPLRFHCLAALNALCSSGRCLAPVLPLLTEVFRLVNFNKRPTEASNRPLNPRLLLHYSVTQLRDKACLDCTFDCLYELCVEALGGHAGCVAFPELALPFVDELKDFMKKCKVANYTKPFKVLLTKIEENCQYIRGKRKSLTSLGDRNATSALETGLSPPFLDYMETYRQARQAELARLAQGKAEDEEEDESADHNEETEDVEDEEVDEDEEGPEDMDMNEKDVDSDEEDMDVEDMTDDDEEVYEEADEDEEEVKEAVKAKKIKSHDKESYRKKGNPMMKSKNNWQKSKKPFQKQQQNKKRSSGGGMKGGPSNKRRKF